MTNPSPHPLDTVYVQNKNHQAVIRGLEPWFIPEDSPLARQQAKQATPPAPAAPKTASPAPVTCPAPAPTTAIATHLPACNPPNLFPSTPHSNLPARRFLAQCQLVFDYTDACANQVQAPPISDEQKILYAASFMRATAGDWVSRWRESTKAEGRSWEQFKKAVLRRFEGKAAPAPKME